MHYSFNPAFTQSSYRWFNNQDASASSTFVKAWGGAGYDEGYAMIKTSDGGYAVTGQTSSYGAGVFDMFLAKYDSSGTLSWSKVWGGTGSENGNAVAQTADGGYVVSGSATSYGAGSNDMFLVKYDSSGNLSWNKVWGGTGTENGNAVAQTADGGYVVSGQTTSFGGGGSDMFLVKYDSSGNFSWNKTWGGTGFDVGYSVVPTSDGGSTVTGYSGSYGVGGDMLLAKYDSSGTLSWSKIWGASGEDYGQSLVQTADGGYAVTGRTSSYAVGGWDMFLAKYDSSGTLSWSKVWGGAANDFGFSLVQTADGGYAVSGQTTSYGAGSEDVFIVKYDSSGTLSWNKTWGGTSPDYGRSVAQTSDGRYAVAGYTNSYGAGNSDMILAKYDSDGTIAGCSSPMCQSPSATVSAPSATNSAPSASVSTPSATNTTPSATVSAPSATSTDIIGGGSSPINVGTALGGVAQNTAAVFPGSQQIVRLRMLLHVGSSIALSGGYFNFKLQYAPRGVDNVCDTSFTNETYADVTTSTPVAYGNNTTAADGGSLTTNANDPSDSGHTIINQQYEEANNATLASTTTSGQDAMWDFALIDNGSAPNTTFCLRVVDSAGVVLSSYSNVPQISSLPANFTQENYRWFQGQDAAPSNTFVQAWGGANGETGYSHVQTSDGGYAVVGRTTNYGAGSADMFLTKYDSSGTLSWSRTWGGAGVDYGFSLVQTSDGGYAVTGFTTSHGAGSGDMFLAKYDSSGTLSWSRTWGGAGVDYGYSLVQTSDGGYAVTGYSTSYGAGSDDMSLIKYDSSGTLSWSRTSGGTGADVGEYLVQTSDGGYAVIGYTTSYGAGSQDMFLAKYDSSGTLSWSRTWGGAGIDYGFSLVQTSDGGFAVSGSTTSYGAGSDDMTLIKYDSSGTLSWSRTWGGTGADYGDSLVQTSDGGFAVSGSTASYGAGSEDMFLAKYDANGTLSWSRTWGGTGADSSYSFVQTSDGGYAVAGDTASYGAGSDDMFLAKYDANGTITGCLSTMCTSPTASVSSPSPSTSSPSPSTSSPSATVGSPTASTSSPTPTATPIVGDMTFVNIAGGAVDETVYNATKTSDGGYVAVGYTFTYGAGIYDVLLSKYNSSGALTWSKTWGGVNNEFGQSVIQTSDGGYAVTGYTDSYGAGSYDLILIKYDSSGTVSWSKTWGAATFGEQGFSLVQTSDGGYAVIGQTATYGAGQDDVAIIKYDSSGTVSWSKTWGGTGTDQGRSIVQTSDGGYVAAVYTDSFGAGSGEVALIKYDSTGTVSWNKTWGGAGSDFVQSITQASEGGYVVTGFTDGYGAGNNDLFIAKYDVSGTLLWNKTLGGTASDIGATVTQTSDGNYAVVGQTASYGAGSNDILLAKYNPSGTLLWSKTWGGTVSDTGAYGGQTSDGGYAAIGTSYSYGPGSGDIVIAKFDSTGSISGCSSMCSSPSPGTSTPSASVSTPSASVSTPSAPVSTPSASVSSPSLTTFYQVAKAIWGINGAVPGTPLAAQDTAASSTRHDTPVRLRAMVKAGSSFTSNTVTLKLQVAPRVGTCDTSFTGETYVDVGGSAAFNYYDNPNLTGGQFALTNANDPTATSGSILYGNYIEAGSFSNRQGLTNVKNELLDISLTPTDEAIYGSYCFRIVKSDNSQLAGYTRVSELSIPPATSQQLRHGQFFDEAGTGTLTPYYW